MMLCVSQLRVCIKNRTILKDLSFSLPSGESIAIMGPSGCGKTTLLKALAGFINAFTHGHIRYDNVLWQDEKRRYCSAEKRDATLLFQNLAIWPHLTVMQQMHLVEPKTAKRNTPKSKEIIEELGLSHRIDTLGCNLSGGEKQRLALGRALKSAPGLLLLDEPFASLDTASKNEAIDLVKRIQTKFRHSIVVSTHDLGEARLLSDRIIILS